MSEFTDKRPNEFDVSNDPFAVADRILINEEVDTPTKIENELSKVENEKVRKLARLFVYAVPRSENAFITDRHRQNIVKDVRFNHALKSIIKDGLPINTESLIQLLVKFVSVRQIAFVNGRKKGLNNAEQDKLGKVFEDDFIGMYYEQNFENFLQNASVKCIDASLMQDRQGNDCFVPLDDNWFYGVDITKKISGINNKKDKQNSETNLQTIFPYEYQGSATVKQPIMTISQMSGHLIVALDMGLGSQLPKYVAALSPDSFDPEVSKQFYDELTDYVLTADGINKYYKQSNRDGSFRLVGEKLARTIGRKAS